MSLASTILRFAQFSGDVISRGGWRAVGGVSAGMFAVAVGASAAAAAGFHPPEILEERCFECHGDGSSKGGLALDELLAAGAEADRGMWLKAWRNVRHEFMPPVDGDPVAADERRAIERWIEQTVFAVDPEQVDPGVVTIRRLNREEYQHTINDLFGIELDLRDRLLPDDSAFGFDNIGDAQTLSPVLFLRYLDLAEWIVSQVVVDSGPPLPSVAFDALGPKPGGDRARKPLVVREGTEQVFDVELAPDGRYRVDLFVGIGGWHDYGGDAVLTIQLGDQPIAEHTVPLGGEVNETYSWEFTATRGQHPLVLRAALAAPPAPKAVAIAVEPENPAPAPPVTPLDPARQEAIERRKAARALDQKIFEENFPEEAAALRLQGRPPPAPPVLKFDRLEVAVTGPLAAGVEGDYPAAHRRVFFRGAAPVDAAGRQEYAAAVLRRFADRAFHRPVDEPTLARLVGLALADDNFERGVGAALAAVLSSPRFLYREEPQPQPDNPRARHPLDEYALASRLSYLLWLSVPDEELNAQAAAGTLRQSLDAQVRRMLADAKSQRFFRDFTGQWLRTRNVLMTAITPGRVADKIEPVREPMKLETDLLFEDIARHDRDLLELITADYTFLNEDLARYYGIAGVTGDEMRKVALPAGTGRGGILSHGSFLIATSNPNRTSPVKRGVFVLENIFGTPPPPPPAAVPALEEAAGHSGELKTLRAQLAAHREDRACAACHAHFDPIGLALENFSYIGRWRDTESGEPIDASGRMVTGETFGSFAELRDLIAARKDKFYRCVTEKLMTYALGRGLEPYDAATVDAITARLMNEGGRFSTLLMAVVESPAFNLRRGDGEPSAAPAAIAQSE